MNINEAFAILGMAATKDENAIKNAYRSLLKDNNPEDNPEGFKQLREAYETACEYVNTPDESEQTEEYDLSTPIGRWSNDIVQIYKSISRRNNIEEWKKLLKSDICYDLDYCEEAKWELFRLLARYFRVPNEVYRLLDETYGIVENEQEFCEHLPVEFVNYMKECLDTEREGFNYQYYEGADDADYDTFREYLYELENMVYSGNVENADGCIKVIEATGIRHPQYTAILARYYAVKGETEKSIEKANEVLNDERLIRDEKAGYMIMAAETLMMAGDRERARDIFEKYSEIGGYFICEKDLAKYYLEEDMLEESIRHIDKALEIGRNDEIQQISQELDVRCIDKYEKEAQEGKLDEEKFSNLMYAYLHMEESDKALELIKANKEFMDNIDKHYKVLISLNVNSENYDKAFDYATTFAGKLEEKLASGVYEEGESEESVKNDLVFAYGSMTNIDVERGLEASDKQTELEYYKKAYANCIKARKYGEKDMQIMLFQADVLYLLGAYEQSCDVCDEVLAINEQIFDAVVKKQRACFRLGRSQDVVDLYYRAKAIYPKRPVTYTYAIREFLKYNQLADARSILEQAYEEDLEEEYAIRVAKQLVEYYETQEVSKKIEIINSIPKLVDEGKEEAYDELSAYLAYFYASEIYDHRQFFDISNEVLRTYSDKALRFDDESAMYLSMSAELYKADEEYDKAMEMYKRIEEIYGDSRAVEFDYADIYIEKDQSELAVEALKKAEEIGADDDYTHRLIAFRYDRLADNINNAAWFRESVKHYTKQIEKALQGQEYDYYRLAAAYTGLEEYDKAYEMVTKAIDIAGRGNATDAMLFLRARILLLKGEYQKAAEYFGMAMNRRSTPYADDKADDTYGIVRHKIIAYRKMGAYDRAINTAIDAFNGFYNNNRLKDSTARLLINTYIESGKFDRARTFINEHLRDIISAYDYSEYMIRILEEETYKNNGDLRNLYNAAVVEYKKSNNEWASYVAAVTSLILKASDEEGVKYLEATLGTTTDSARDKMDWLIDSILIFKYLGHEDKASYYINIFEQILAECYPKEKGYTSIDKYIEESYNHLLNLSQAVIYWCVTGHVDIAAKYIDRLMAEKDDPLKCIWRNDVRKQALAVYYEASGDKEKAMALLKELSDDYESYYAIVRMRRMYGAVFKSSDSNSASKNVNSNGNNTGDNTKENNTGKWSLLEQLKKHLKK